MNLFTFINTSGGGTRPAPPNIRGDKMTWAGVSQVDREAHPGGHRLRRERLVGGPDAAWDSAANINARMNDGVISIIQYNPSSSWGSTISSVRAQLNTPPFCP